MLCRCDCVQLSILLLWQVLLLGALAQSCTVEGSLVLFI